MGTIYKQVSSFYLDLTRPNTRILLVSLRANGDSSYRDANAMSQLCIDNIHIPATNICIVTDTPSRIRTSGVRVIEVRNKRDLIETIKDEIRVLPLNAQLIFSISAHGYSKRVHDRIPYELNGLSEYLLVRGECVLDCELFDAVYQNMHDSIKSLCLVDTCHSGTMLDLEYLSTDGVHFNRSRIPLQHRPLSICISACNDNENAGEDISDFGGWGGKLTCQVLDYLLTRPTEYKKFYPLDMYTYIQNIFQNQSYQRTHPVISFNTE